MASPETQLRKPLELTICPEGYWSPADATFLDTLKDAIIAHGLEPDQLVFSGFDGTEIKTNKTLPRHHHIFAMDEAGWREAIGRHEQNPAQYAMDYDTPCIGLYDRSQLAEPYHYDASTVAENEDGTFDDRTEIKNVQMGRLLGSEPLALPVNEAVVHADYPSTLATDALVGLVYIES